MSGADPYSITFRDAFQGEPLKFQVTWWDVPPDPNALPPVVGVPHDISGWHFMFTMKKKLTDADSQAIYMWDFLIAVGAGVSGVSAWEVPATVIDTIEAKFLYYWDLRAILPSGTEPTERIAGTVFLNASVGQRLVPNP